MEGGKQEDVEAKRTRQTRKGNRNGLFPNDLLNIQGRPSMIGYAKKELNLCVWHIL